MPEPIKNVCAVCGRPPPEGLQACPHDGSTLFVEAPTLDPLVGQQLGDYQVLEVIGEGGMGLVYRGIQPVIKKRVAIKVLRTEFASDPAQVKRLVSEAESVNSISHRNIIDIFGLGQLADGRHYIIMEFLDGDPLDKHLRERAPLQPLEVAELLIDICGPLFAAHSAGVIHRDLKPSNVFLVQQPDGTRYLKLLDFGLAKKGVNLDGKTSQTSATQIAGTPDYMAPEQCRGLDISPRTDLYALGVMAWQMLTGRLPFPGPTPMDVVMAQVSAPAVAPSTVQPGVPPELDALVLWLMQKDPEARPASAEVVRSELKRIGMGLREGPNVHTTRAWTGEMKAVDLAKYARGPTPAPGSAAVPSPLASPAPFSNFPAFEPSSGTDFPPVPPGAPGVRVAVPADPLVTGQDAAPVSGFPPLVAEEPEPVRRQSGLPLIAAVLGLVVATVVWVWANGEKKEPPQTVPLPPVTVSAPPPVEPQLPVVAEAAQAREPGSEPGTESPTAVGKSPMLRHPAKDTTPSAADLSRRVQQLENKLRARAGSGETADPSALQLLDKQRLRLTMSLSSVERRDVSKKLDNWERTFLKH